MKNPSELGWRGQGWSTRSGRRIGNDERFAPKGVNFGSITGLEVTAAIFGLNVGWITVLLGHLRGNQCVKLGAEGKRESPRLGLGVVVWRFDDVPEALSNR